MVRTHDLKFIMQSDILNDKQVSSTKIPFSAVNELPIEDRRQTRYNERYKVANNEYNISNVRDNYCLSHGMELELKTCNHNLISLMV